jgi:membrane protein
VAADAQDRSSVLGFFFEYFPTQFDFLTAQLTAFQRARLEVNLLFALSLVWASLGVFGAVTTAVNEAWGVEKQRSFLRHRLVSFVMLAAAGGVVLAAVLFLGFLRVAQASWFGRLVTEFSWLTVLQAFVFRYVATLLLIGGVGLVFYFVPNARTRFRDVWVGAVLTGLLWRVAGSAFSWYVEHSPTLREIQGSITTVIVFLLWIYVSSVILMYGVEFTAAYARLRAHRYDDAPAAPPLEE